MSLFNQMHLEIKLDDQATFDNFYAPKGSSQQLAKFLLQQSGHRVACLIGNSGCGLSHLLQASCQRGPFDRGSDAIYLPLSDLQGYPPQQILEGLESASLVCLDDLQAVANQQEWQVPLFNFFNECKQSGTRLIFSSHQLLEDIGISLPDLLSRLQSGLVHIITDFNDDDLRRLLQFRCNLRGMYLSDEVAKFLLARLSRDSKTLISALETLDSASLREQRRLTTPFVKSVLDI
ncbi:MAG: DnaA regulatory inactivator Hda [Porticoccaceae bacterium]